MDPVDQPALTSSRPPVKVVVAWIVLAPWIVVLAIRLLGIDFNQWLVALIGLTPFVAAASLFPLLLALALRVWAAAITAALVIAMFAFLVLPRVLGGPTEATPPGPPLKVVAANMMLGQGSAADLVALVNSADADVLSVEELTPELAQQLDALGIDERLPHRALLPADGPHGSGLYSRYPLIDPNEDQQSLHLPFLSATVEPPGAEPVQVSSVHTVPPTVRGWEEDLDAMPGPPADGRGILLGDFNATIDHAPFRGLLGRGWDDAAATVGKGLVPTWPEGRRVPPIYAIDHVLVGDVIGIRDFSAHDIASTDHRAVYAELQLPGD